MYLTKPAVRYLSYDLLANQSAAPLYVIIKKQKDNIVISVQDFGIGIHNRDKTKIFEPFYQASNKIRQSFSGFDQRTFVFFIKAHKSSIAS